MKVEVEVTKDMFRKAGRKTKSAAGAVPVRLDPKAVVFVGVGAGVGAAVAAGLAAAAAPVAICTTCIVVGGATHGAAWYGVSRAVSVRHRNTALIEETA